MTPKKATVTPWVMQSEVPVTHGKNPEKWQN